MVIFVRRVCDTFRFESPPLRGKKIEFGTDSLLLPQERRGAKTTQSVFFEKATPSQEHGLCPPLGFQPPFPGTKTTRNVTWGSILTPCRKKKMLKTAGKLKLDKNKKKGKMEFRAYNSKGVDKNGAKCNMGFSGV